MIVLYACKNGAKITVSAYLIAALSASCSAFFPTAMANYKKTPLLFECFPHVCPEPVLVE
jgi:hypothetical protein